MISEDKKEEKEIKREDDDSYNENSFLRKEPQWQSNRELQDIRNGTLNEDISYGKHETFHSSLLSNWRELYSWAVRMSRDKVFLPSYFVGSPAVIMAVVQYGDSIGMTEVESLLQLIPMKGFICIRGDAMMSLIATSGVLKKWEESEKGTFGRRTYKYTIKASRTDRKGEKSVSFGYEELNRSGLYISPSLYDQVRGGLSKSQEIRFRYPERVCRYMALNFMVKDMFPDVSRGRLIAEAVEHYDNYDKVIREDGTAIPGKPMKVVAESQKRNERLLSTLEIDGQLGKDKDGRLEIISEATENILDDKKTLLFDTEGRVLDKEKYTEEEIFSLKGSRTKHLNTIIAHRHIMVDFLPKLSPDEKRQLILHHQKGWSDFKMYIVNQWGKRVSDNYDDLLRQSKPEKIKRPSTIKAEGSNKYSIKVPRINSETGERELSEALDLKADLENFVVESEKQFMSLILGIKDSNGRSYTGMIDFCRRVPSAKLNAWLNKRN